MYKRFFFYICFIKWVTDFVSDYFIVNLIYSSNEWFDI